MLNQAHSTSLSKNTHCAEDQVIITVNLLEEVVNFLNSTLTLSWLKSEKICDDAKNLISTLTNLRASQYNNYICNNTDFDKTITEFNPELINFEMDLKRSSSLTSLASSNQLHTIDEVEEFDDTGSNIVSFGISPISVDSNSSSTNNQIRFTDSDVDFQIIENNTKKIVEEDVDKLLRKSKLFENENNKTTLELLSRLKEARVILEHNSLLTTNQYCHPSASKSDVHDDSYSTCSDENVVPMENRQLASQIENEYEIEKFNGDKKKNNYINRSNSEQKILNSVSTSDSDEVDIKTNEISGYNETFYNNASLGQDNEYSQNGGKKLSPGKDLFRTNTVESSLSKSSFFHDDDSEDNIAVRSFSKTSFFKPYPTPITSFDSSRSDSDPAFFSNCNNFSPYSQDNVFESASQPSSSQISLTSIFNPSGSNAAKRFSFNTEKKLLENGSYSDENCDNDAIDVSAQQDFALSGNLKKYNNNYFNNNFGEAFNNLNKLKLRDDTKLKNDEEREQMAMDEVNENLLINASTVNSTSNISCFSNKSSLYKGGARDPPFSSFNANNILSYSEMKTTLDEKKLNLSFSDLNEKTFNNSGLWKSVGNKNLENFLERNGGNGSNTSKMKEIQQVKKISSFCKLKESLGLKKKKSSIF
ncbi:hypothetical protein HDU92_003303 [Lobulomyces angularis]|nr:hypothetical protein HDU92_003303 [Lobulomyces angularis]